MTGSLSRVLLTLLWKRSAVLTEPVSAGAIMTTVSGTNIEEIPDIIDAVVKAGANVFAFARYCPTSEEKEVGIEPCDTGGGFCRLR